jgi:hypothetical protein
MSGSGGTQTTTTKNALPAWAVPYAQEILGAGASTFMPGGQPGDMPANMQQQVAGMTPDQIQAMSMIQQRAGGPAIANAPSMAALPAGVAAGSSLPTAGAANPVNATVGGTAAPVNNPPVSSVPPPPPPPPPAPAPTPAPKKKKKK